MKNAFSRKFQEVERERDRERLESKRKLDGMKAAFEEEQEDTKKQVKKKLNFELLPRANRWYMFIPKIPIWVHFGGPWNGNCCYILRSFGKFMSLSYTYIVAHWYIFALFRTLYQEKSGNPAAT
jgi:hypothetical protein